MSGGGACRSPQWRWPRRKNQRRTLADSGFARESAFKLAFGLPPSQARKRSAQLRSPAGGTRNIELGADFAQWMRTLRA
jgi:hypothetical protein